jgi:hypothetical protein
VLNKFVFGKPMDIEYDTQLKNRVPIWIL